MPSTPLHFYPGSGPAAALPLARYLPPLPVGMASAWLTENIPGGGWLLDPLGASPGLALEAARAGYRVLVASNNPILSFLTEILASAPKTADFQSALAELATARRGEERLDRHIQLLYQTECDTCGDSIQAQAFLWRKGEAEPFARLYHCPRCGESGERAVTPADIKRLSGMGGDKMQRSRALQRVILNEEEHRADVEEALENYLARPLYVLFTLLNKIEGLGLPPERARLLHALMLSLFDAGSTLWPWPGGRSRPKQLTVPPTFRENNLWIALEESAAQWTTTASAQGTVSQEALPVPVTHWPELPSQNGICLFRGRVKALMPLPDEIGPRAVLAAFPRPNQAFWTLSVLWAGWLWGAEAALPLRNVLDRRRYDWNWHTSAMHSALAAVGWNIPAETPFFGILPELAPGFLSAAIVACESAGFVLEGLAVRGDNPGRAEQDLAQGLWQPIGSVANGPPEQPMPAAKEMEKIAREAMRSDLRGRCEPATYLMEYAAGLSALAKANAIPRSPNGIAGDLLSRVQAVLARNFSDRSFLRLYGARSENGPAEEERGMWWLARPEDACAGERQAEQMPEPAALPLADRIEMEVIRFMQRRASFSAEELDQALCLLFPGLLTPPLELVRACLESYAEPIPVSGQAVSGQPGGAPKAWRMRPTEVASARKADLQEMRGAIEQIGQRLGFDTLERGSLLVWEKNGAGQWWFYRMASSIFSRYVIAPRPGPANRCVLVLPGGRARLASYKLHRDPRLAEASQGWRFLKFRHMREIAASDDLTLKNWESLLDDDPLTDDAVQMQLFSS